MPNLVSESEHTHVSRQVTLRVATVVRERLFQDADEAPTPLTLLHAPAGFGKTVAAVHRAEELADRGIRVLWVTGLSHSPRQDEQFWDSFARAGNANSGGYAAVEQWVSSLVAPTHVIIEDYEWVTNHETDAALARLLSLNAHLSLLVLSRRFASLDGPVMKSQVKSRTITDLELKFTDHETASLAASCGIVRDELVTEIQTDCDGWPLTIAGVLRELTADASATEMRKAVAKYAHQFYESLSTDNARRVFLAATSGDSATPKRIAKLARMSEEQCAAELMQLQTLGFVRRRLYADGHRILAHQGVRLPLEDLARKTFGSQRVRKWQIKNAVSFSDIEPVLAFGALLRCEAYEEAQVVLTKHFLRTMVGERVLLYQLRGVPEERLDHLPVLIAARLLLEQMDPLSDPDEVKRLTAVLKRSGHNNAAEESSGGDISTELVTLAILSVAERMQGNASSLEYARSLQRRMESNRGGALLPIALVLPFLHAVAAFTGMLNGDFELAERGYVAAQQTAKELGEVDEYLRAVYGRAAIAALTGRMRDATDLLEVGNQYQSFTGAVSPQLNWMHRDLAVLLLALDDLELEQARSLLQSSQLMLHRVEQWPMFAVAEAAIEQLSSETSERQRLVSHDAKEHALFTVVPYLGHLLGAGAATRHIRSGDYQAASRELDGLSLSHPRVAIAHAQLRLMLGDNSQAAHLATRLAEHADSPRLRSEALLVAALARLELGEHELAAESAEQAVTEMTAHNLQGPLRALPYAELCVLADALGKKGATELGRMLARIPEHMRFEPHVPLTKAELRTVGALPTHHTVAGIAEALYLSPNTVKSHLKSIYRKLRVTKRSDAIVRAKQLGLL